jgi:hypothetical protein
MTTAGTLNSKAALKRVMAPEAMSPVKSEMAVLWKLQLLTHLIHVCGLADDNARSCW